MSVLLTARKIAATSRSLIEGARAGRTAVGAVGLAAVLESEPRRKSMHADKPSSEAKPARRTKANREEAMECTRFEDGRNLFTRRNDGACLRWVLSFDKGRRVALRIELCDLERRHAERRPRKTHDDTGSHV